MSLFGECSKSLQLSGENNNTITKRLTTDYQNAVYFANWIPSNTDQVHKWRITNNVNPTNSGIQIAFITPQHHHDTATDIDRKGAYLYTNIGATYQDGGSKSGAGPYLEADQSMILTLDLQQSQIRARMDDKFAREKVLFDNIGKGDDVQYKLAVSIRYIKDSVTVTAVDDDESAAPTASDIEQKQDVLSDVENVDNAKLLQLMDQTSKLYEEIQQKTKQNQQLTDTMAELKKQNEALKERVSTLENEKKELEITNRELKEENKRLKTGQIDTENWKEWSYEQVVAWMVSLDGSIGQYEEILSTSLKAEDVNGECLATVQITRNDVMRWGVSKLMHANKVLTGIQQLISNKTPTKSMAHETSYEESVAVAAPAAFSEGYNAPTSYI